MIYLCGHKLNLKRLSVFALFLLVLVFVYKRLLFDPKSIALGEALSFWTYGLALIQNFLENFRQIPLWDSHLSSGFSAVGDPQVQQFYPLSYLFLGFSDPLLITRFYIFLHLAVAGVSFIFLGLYLKIKRPAVLLGAVTYLCNSYILINIENGFFPDLVTMAWLPLVFLFLTMAIREKNLWFSILASIAFSMIIFSGGAYGIHYTFILSAIFIFSYVALTVIRNKGIRNSLKEILFSICVFFTFALFSILLSSVKLLPVLEYGSLSSRSTFSLSYAESNIADSPIIAALNNIFTKYFISTDPTSFLAILIHALFFLLVFLSIFSRIKYISIPVIIVTLIAILGSFGKAFPVDIYSFFYYLVPGFKSQQYPTRFLLLTWFTFPLLASLGLDMILRIKKNIPFFVGRYLGYIIIILICFFSISLTKKSIDNYSFLTYSAPEASIFLKNLNKNTTDFRIYNKWIWGTASALNYQALEYNFNTISPLCVCIAPNYYQLDFTGQEFSHFYSSDSTEEEFFEKKYKLLSILNTEYVISSKEYQKINSNVKVIKTFLDNKGAEVGFINENKRYRSRVDFLPQGILIIGEDKNDLFNAIKARSVIFTPEFDIFKTTIFTAGSPYVDDYSVEFLKNFSAVILYDSSFHKKDLADTIIARYKSEGGSVFDKGFFIKNNYEQRRAPNSLFTGKPAFFLPDKSREELKRALDNTDNSQFKIIKKEQKQGYLRVDFESSDKGFLIFSETYYPGWEVFLDGKQMSSYMADSLVKGVVISSSGRHEVVFQYKPGSFFWGAFISGSTAIFLVCLFFWKSAKFFKKRKL